MVAEPQCGDRLGSGWFAAWLCISAEQAEEQQEMSSGCSASSHRVHRGHSWGVGNMGGEMDVDSVFEVRWGQTRKKGRIDYSSVINPVQRFYLNYTIKKQHIFNWLAITSTSWKNYTMIRKIILKRWRERDWEKDIKEERSHRSHRRGAGRKWWCQACMVLETCPLWCPAAESL